MSDPRLWIFLSNNKNCIITAYSDSDWAACPDTRRSVSGYIVLMGDSIICWKSKKQTTISLSSAEAEYRAVRNVVGELVWLEILMTELHVPCNLPIFVFCDIKTVVHIARNPVLHERTSILKLTAISLGAVAKRPHPTSPQTY